MAQGQLGLYGPRPAEIRPAALRVKARVYAFRAERAACFTASPYGLRHDKPGTLPGADEASGGPTPGIDYPGVGNGDATPSTPTLQEPPPAER